MKLQLLSDLHVDFVYRKAAEPLVFYSSLIPDNPPDLLVIAGDLGECLDAISGWKRTEYERVLTLFCSKYRGVLLIPGNHDFYHGSFDRYRRMLGRLDLPNLYAQKSQNGILSFQLDEFTIHACTLWFPPRPTNILHFREMNDYHLIEDSLHQIEVYGQRQANLLLKAVKPGDIVVTHHAPIPNIHSRYGIGNPINKFYYNELAEKVIDECKPRLWCFGHTHLSEKKKVGETLLVSNPAGYYGYGEGHMSVQNSDFVPQLILRAEGRS